MLLARMGCITTVPVDGYCEYTAHGNTERGMVVGRRAARQPLNSIGAGRGT
jgi:hypothetical protein